jgi:hypothetical protein
MNQACGRAGRARAVAFYADARFWVLDSPGARPASSFNNSRTFRQAIVAMTCGVAAAIAFVATLSLSVLDKVIGPW